MLEPARGYVAIYEEFKGNASQDCSQWNNSGVCMKSELGNTKVTRVKLLGD